MDPTRGLIAELVDEESEQHERHRRGQREAEPGEERASGPGTQEADRDTDLAARRTRQRLTEGDDLGVRRFVEPLPANDVLTSEVAEVRDGSTERGEPEPERDEEDLERR